MTCPRTNWYPKAILPCLALLILGCAHTTRASDDARSEVIRELAESARSVAELLAKTHNGNITMIGTSGDQVKVTSRVRAKAPSKTRADELIEDTRVSLRREGSRLVAHVDRPRTGRNESVSVDLDIQGPMSLVCDLRTHNGTITVSDVAGFQGNTHNGKVRAKGINGRLDYELHNGSIRCIDVAGPVEVGTHNGSVIVELREGADPNCSIETHNGRIDLDIPDNTSAQVSLRSHNGGITTDIPIQVVGKLKRNRIQGVLGDGTGRISLQSHNGAIKLR